MTLLFKYFVCFDDDGDIKSLCIDKKNIDKCDKSCQEYIIKLMPIERNNKNDYEMLSSKVEDLLGTVKKFDNELDKTLRKIKRRK
jgi:hypothetical protein